MDRGLEFAGKVTDLCKELRIKRSVISSKHPQGNGMAERYVGIVKRCLKTMLSEDDKFYSDWLEVIPACLMGLRFLQHKTLGLAPFTVIHGLIPKIPLRDYDILPSEEWDEKEFNLADLVETVKYIHEEVLDKLRIADMKEKLAYDIK